jgi:hypothetical protein
MMMRAVSKRATTSIALFWALTIVSQCAAVGATIDVGIHALSPNTPAQQVSLFVTGGEAVSGLNFYAQVGDGGPELSQVGLPAGEDGPEITSVDLKMGTIFAAAPSPQDNQAGLPQVAIASIEFTTVGATTTANGLLARLSIDTTGFTAGSWSLRLADVLPQLAGGPYNSDFAGIPATIVNGSIVVTSTVVGDFNLDGSVGRADLRLLAEHFGQTGPATRDQGDLDGDRVIGLSDLAILQSRFDEGAAAAAVPEPVWNWVFAIMLAMLAKFSGRVACGKSRGRLGEVPPEGIERRFFQTRF